MYTIRERKIEVLLIEDNSADRFWLECTLKMVGLSHALSVVGDGQRAVDFLLKRGKHSGAPTPDVIFLDVHLPILSGPDVLRQIPNPRKLPVCVLTGSEEDSALFRREFGIQESNFVLKPVSRDKVLKSAVCRECFGT